MVVGGYGALVIITVSTVKDSLPNLQAFVGRNLAGGADHLIVFLDAPGDDPAVESWLATLEHVTVVATDDAYWGGERPESLNDRQLVNANLANRALAETGLADWLFHIDADESLQVDTARLAALPATTRLVRIAPIEAVSRPRWEGEVTHFKPLLPRERIDDLVARGLIPGPGPKEHPNATWFSGHVMGKLGLRPDAAVRLELHKAYDASGTQLDAFAADWLLHRHYESHSGEEFVRKWMAHLGAGEIRLRPRRARLLTRIRAIADDPSLDAAGRQAALEQIYRDEIEDDLDALLPLGVLVEPAAGTHTPARLGAVDRQRLAEALAPRRTDERPAARPGLLARWRRR